MRAHPDIYPGFYSLPTPNKNEKRHQLDQVMRSLTRMIGRTVFDPRTALLLKEDAADVERELLAAHSSAAERIGVGLALGFFRRTRRRKQFEAGVMPFEGTRGASLVRERPEFAAAGKVTASVKPRSPNLVSINTGQENIQ